MKRGQISILILSILAVAVLLAIALYFIHLLEKPLLFAPPSLPIPSNCSNENITALWDAVFVESSAGITIISNTSQQGKCSIFLAYKITGNIMSLISGTDINTFGINITVLMAMKGNFTDEYLSIIRNITSTENDTYFDTDSDSLLPEMYMANRTINQSEADSEFRSAFRITPGAWIINATADGTDYSFIENETMQNITKVSVGITEANYSISAYSFIQIINPSIPSCIPNWTAVNNPCQPGDRRLTWYNDTKKCNNETGMPANETFHCDYDSNGIIGNISLSSSPLNFSVSINGSIMNASKNYSSYSSKVELKSGSDVRVEFNWTFSTPLDIDSIYIEKQPSSATRGWLLVKGISANKKIYVDKISDTNRICIKNSEIPSISDLSSNCAASGEIEMPCPGNDSSIFCSVSGSYYQVSGLTSSAVREYASSTPGGNCTPTWVCTNWSTCINNKQNKTCTDTHYCNTTSGRPPLNQSCSVSPSVCTPSWDCNDWRPSPCPESGNQTRTCTDLNSCNSNRLTKIDRQSCTYESPEKGNSAVIWIIVIITILTIVVILVIIFLINKDKTPAISHPQSQSMYSQNQSSR